MDTSIQTKMVEKVYKTTMDKYSLVREPSNIHRAKINAPDVIIKYARSFWKGIDIYESIYIVMLNTASNTIGYVKIGQGGINSVAADVRLMAKYAIECLAASVILIHNHPSGHMTPSSMDRKLTKQAKQAFDLFEINLLDHIIIGPEENQSYSFLSEGII